MDRLDNGAWYDANKNRYQDLTGKMLTLLETLLQEAGIPYSSVTGRLKTRDSFLEKMERKEYESPEQMMDVAALRVITQTTIEVGLVCELFRREFQVDKQNSADKSAALAEDQVGYRSVHYVVTLNKARTELPEYARFQGLRFEIQVRSMLQNAWAEIEHDRSYKFAGGELRPDLRRRFHLVAGTLEMLDREFQSLSEEIDAYARHVQEETKKGNLNISIDATSLLQYLQEQAPGRNASNDRKEFRKQGHAIIELKQFGIKTLRQLEQKLPLLPQVLEDRPERTYIGALRDAMILADPRKYFAEAWKEKLWNIDCRTLNYWRDHSVEMDKLKDILYVEPLENGGCRIALLSKQASGEAESPEQVKTVGI